MSTKEQLLCEIRDFFQDIASGAPVTGNSIEHAKQFVFELDALDAAQSEKPCGEPVAWRWKTVPGGNQWFVRDYEPDLELIAVHSVEPLYASPPSSSWGLRERVATIVKEYMSGIESEHLRNIFQEMLHDIDEELSSVSSTPRQTVSEASFCALCDLEYQLHEDAQGFHHVVKGERAACSGSSTDKSGAA